MSGTLVTSCKDYLIQALEVEAETQEFKASLPYRLGSERLCLKKTKHQEESKKEVGRVAQWGVSCHQT